MDGWGGGDEVFDVGIGCRLNDTGQGTDESGRVVRTVGVLHRSSLRREVWTEVHSRSKV